MVGRHGCIRGQKMAIPLIEAGHEVHLVAMKVPSFWEQYRTFTLCADVGQMQAALRMHCATKPDLFHVHNEPSWFVSMLKEMTEVPVVLDVHDSYLARSTGEEATAALDAGKSHIRVSTEERNNFQLADALVFPGDHFRTVVTSEFKLAQPTLTLPSYVPRRFYCYSTRDWHGGLVYEGKINLPPETKGFSAGFTYCDYTDLAARCKALGMDLHFYSARSDDKFRKHFGETAFLHKPLAFDDLLPAVSRHDWGLVGNVTQTREWSVAMPNKLFEYAAAGVPTVAMNADACAEFLHSTGMGISVSGPEELASRWSEHREVRKQVIKQRQQWSMDAHIPKLVNFYKEVLRA